MKNFIIFIVPFIGMLFSCSSQDFSVSSEEVSSQNKSGIIKLARTKAKKVFSLVPTTRSSQDESLVYEVDAGEADLEVLEMQLTEYLGFVEQNDVFVLFEENGINPNLGYAMSDYYDGGLTFEGVVDKYNLSAEDIQFFAYSTECLDYIKEDMPESGLRTKELSCALGVVASIVTTVSAASPGICTPAGLGVWLFAKAVSIASLSLCK